MMRQTHVKTLAAMLMAATALALTMSDSAACSCRKSSRADVVARADLVFVGTPVSVHSVDARTHRTTFRVHRTIKGKTGSRVTIHSGKSAPACGVDFRRRKGPVTVPAFRARNGTLVTNSCAMFNIGR